MEFETQIKNKLNLFFEWINLPIIKNYYLKNTENWQALCASLHIVKDLQRAKSEYQKLESINYLESIGIIQTIYIEQDSMNTLKSAIHESNENKFSLNNYDNIRDIRNKAFGHPSEKRKKNEISTRHFFDIIDQDGQGIKHITWGIEENVTSVKTEIIKISDLVKENSQITLSYLEEFETALKEKFKNIMANYKISFKEILENSTYTFEKLLCNEFDDFVISAYPKFIDDEIKKVRAGLEERNLLDNIIDQDIKVIEFFSNKLKPLFSSQTYNDIEFYAYASTLRDSISSLKDRLREIDNPFG